ncbi:hypothetical protein LP417_27655 [Polaromonas sp. P1-6]|nr:hypothetical protein LP417_27655 [Polaromonas sp. P1-6]
MAMAAAMPLRASWRAMAEPMAPAPMMAMFMVFPFGAMDALWLWVEL